MTTVSFARIYQRIEEILRQPRLLHRDWAMIEQGLRQLLRPQPAGPDRDAAPVLDHLRATLEAVGRNATGPAQLAMGAEILRVSQPDKPGFEERAAFIKFMQHVYLETKGGQAMWVVDHPESYPLWSFDTLAGRSPKDLAVLLALDDEVFGPENRRTLTQALQLARRWSAITLTELGRNTARSQAAVHRWFLLPGATELEFLHARRTLLHGFNLIFRGCNSGQVIFSDSPIHRTIGEAQKKHAGASTLDLMLVIYPFSKFLEWGRRTPDGLRPTLWECALTIVHELSHKLCATQDIRWAEEGLRPGAAFPPAAALVNTYSWEHFCGDLLNGLPPGRAATAWV